jgi:hypothetical protein
LSESTGAPRGHEPRDRDVVDVERRLAIGREDHQHARRRARARDRVEDREHATVVADVETERQAERIELDELVCIRVDVADVPVHRRAAHHEEVPLVDQLASRHRSESRNDVGEVPHEDRIARCGSDSSARRSRRDPHRIFGTRRDRDREMKALEQQMDVVVVAVDRDGVEAGLAHAEDGVGDRRGARDQLPVPVDEVAKRDHPQHVVLVVGELVDAARFIQIERHARERRCRRERTDLVDLVVQRECELACRRRAEHDGATRLLDEELARAIDDGDSRFLADRLAERDEAAVPRDLDLVDLAAGPERRGGARLDVEEAEIVVLVDVRDRVALVGDGVVGERLRADGVERGRLRIE